MLVGSFGSTIRLVITVGSLLDLFLAVIIPITHSARSPIIHFLHSSVHRLTIYSTELRFKMLYLQKCVHVSLNVGTNLKFQKSFPLNWFYLIHVHSQQLFDNAMTMLATLKVTKSHFWSTVFISLSTFINLVLSG